MITVRELGRVACGFLREVRESLESRERGRERERERELASKPLEGSKEALGYRLHPARVRRLGLDRVRRERKGSDKLEEQVEWKASGQA